MKFSRSIGLIALLLTLCSSQVSFLAYAEDTAGNSTSTASSTEPVVEEPVGPKRTDLEAKIREKSEALDKINRELASTNQNLKSAQEQKNSLQRELQQLQSNINQLDLNIQADQLTGQKLSLEIESLNYDIRDIQFTVSDKTKAIGQLLRELQKSSSKDVLTIFLSNSSLADSVLETQSLRNVRSQLAIDIENLNSLEKQMSGKLSDVSSKKSEIQTHQKNLANRKLIVEDQKEDRKVILTETKSKEAVYAKQVDELKAQQETMSDEIAKIEEQLRLSFDISLLPLKRPGVFAWPIQMTNAGGRGQITQHYGEVSKLYRGRPHNGLDIGAPVGTPVMAAEDGVVIAVDNNDRSRTSKYQYGKYILIKHPNNLATLYAHLSSQAVQKGAQVKRGDVIGYVGATGYATGPHLHFGAYWAASIQMKPVPPAAGLVPIGVVVKPEDYL